jgi:deoxyribonuclease-4
MGRQKVNLGSHMSVAGGLENAFFAGKRVGCNCLQIFVKNQRQWRAPPLGKDQITAYKGAERETGLSPVVAHASYLLNLASPEATTRKKSIAAMVDELERCEALGVSALVFHPGAHMKDTLQAGMVRVAKSLDEVHRTCAGFRTMILLESTAGQGSAIGYRFAQLGAILDGAREPDRLGICLDTCHLFAAGYDFRKAEGYAAMIDEMDCAVGVATIRCIHMNDSKKKLGSRVDRHDHIGKGKIGKQGFAHFVNDKRWHGIPMILETPKGKDGRGTEFDKVNLKRLRGLVGMADVK